VETHLTPAAVLGSPSVTVTNDRKLILAASLGTIFEWYDSYLYGSLAVTISKQFFSGVDQTTGSLPLWWKFFLHGFVTLPCPSPTISG